MYYIYRGVRYVQELYTSNADKSPESKFVDHLLLRHISYCHALMQSLSQASAHYSVSWRLHCKANGMLQISTAQADQKRWGQYASQSKRQPGSSNESLVHLQVYKAEHSQTLLQPHSLGSPPPIYRLPLQSARRTIPYRLSHQVQSKGQQLPMCPRPHKASCNQRAHCAYRSCSSHHLWFQPLALLV